MTRGQRQARLYRLTMIAMRIGDRIVEYSRRGRPTRVLTQRLGRLQREKMRTATGPQIVRAFEGLGGFESRGAGGERFGSTRRLLGRG